MGKKSLFVLMPLGCAFILLGALNHATLHVNVPRFAIILGVLGVVCIAVGGWASIQELRGGSSTSRASTPAPVAYGTAPASGSSSGSPDPAPVVATPDDPTIQA